MYDGWNRTTLLPLASLLEARTNTMSTVCRNDDNVHCVALSQNDSQNGSEFVLTLQQT